MRTHTFSFAERLLQTLSAVRGSTRVGSRDREDRAWPDQSVKSGSGQTGWWPEQGIKGASERTMGKKHDSLPRATSTAIASECPFKKPKERPPTPFPLPARHRPTRLQKKAQQQVVDFPSCACRSNRRGVV